MATKAARSRDFKVFIPAMIGYLISIFGVSSVIDKSADVSTINYVVALIPSIFVFVWVWSHARFILEIDEFVRMLQIKSILYGLVALMGFTTAWGLLEIYAHAPKVPLFFGLPGFYLCYGVAAMVIGKRNNAGCQML